MIQVQIGQFGCEQIALNVFVDIVLLSYSTGKINLHITEAITGGVL